jgi:acetyl-CoA synthetase
MPQTLYPVSAAISASAHANKQEYQRLYQWSLDDPAGFWREQGRRIDWSVPFSLVKNCRFAKDAVSIKWYEDGQLNAS